MNVQDTSNRTGAEVHRKKSLEDRVEICELVIRALTDGLTELASDLEKRVERLENPETQPDPEERAS